MSWLGIPFNFANEISRTDAVVEITKLPPLVIDSGFSWEGIIGSLIAGCIPAFIAWKTIKSNNEVMRRQIILSAQQKRIDELKELCANYIAIRSNAIEYTDLIYQQYDGDRTKIPLEIISDLRNDYLKMHRCINLINLTIGPSDPLSIEIGNEIDRMDKSVNNFFDNYNTVRRSISETQYMDDDLLMSLFSKALDRESKKIYS